VIVRCISGHLPIKFSPDFQHARLILSLRYRLVWTGGYAGIVIGVEIVALVAKFVAIRVTKKSASFKQECRWL
jgi:hypothetical protein